MDWFSILKMPNPYGGKWSNLTGDEYYRMDDKNKRLYHSAMHGMYVKQIKRAVEPRKAGQAPPATDEQIRGLRELGRFHSRQHERMKDPSINKENYYSLEEEKNRQMSKPQYDAVERIPLTTKEMYDKYSREQKMAYWNRLRTQLITEYGNNYPKGVMAGRMFQRMQHNPNYTPTFEGDETTGNEYKDLQHRDISEYDNFTDEEKRKYHARMRNRKDVDVDVSRFHRRMVYRIKTSNLPTYPTPEAEKEAEQ